MSKEQVTKEIYISSTPHETRLAITEDDNVVEVHYERENEYTLAGAIYNGKVTRVLPGMQSAFVDVGLERDAFLYVTDFLEEQEDSGDFERTALPPRKDKEREKEPRAEAGDNSGGIAIDASTDAGQPQEADRRLRRRRRGGRGGAQPPDAAAVPQDIEVTVESEEPFGGPGEFDSAAAAQSEDAQPDSDRREARRSRWRERRSQRTHSDEPDEPHESAYVPPAGSGPVVLPGESLRKLRKGGTSAGSSEKTEAKPVLKHRPSTEVAALTWDGSTDVLPGESLSKRRKRNQPQAREKSGPVMESRPAGLSSESASEPQPGFAEAAAHEQHGHGEHPAAETLEHFDFAASAEEMSETEEVDEREPSGSDVPEAVAQPAQDFLPSDDESVEQAGTEIHEEFEEEEQELESGSASHRVDPNPPSEFRSWFGRKKEPETADKIQASELSEEEIAAARHKLAHDVGHELAHQPTTGDEVFPAVPDFVTEEGEAASHVAHQLGSGQIEEELIEEDEYDFEPMHQDGDESELEGMTEETLESSGELGEYLRDSQVEQSTDEFDEDADSEGEEEAEQETIVLGDADAGEDGQEGQPRRRRRGDRRGIRSRRGSERGSDRDHAPESGRRGGPQQRRRSAQLSDLPVITELLKPGQEILVQIAKEPIAKKGARITSHIALPGRFLVFMPTVNHVGVSRKISSDEDRQRLKRILLSEKGDAAGGFIVRTAAGSASEADLRADIRFLINLWNEIKQRSEGAKSPALIYHDLNLVERVLRDQVTDKFAAIWVDTEAEYERVVRFLSRFQPALVRHVKLYTKETPLFEQFGVQEEINKALKSKVWLKSGGSIVINQTEALVAIDINTGKYVGKTARLEDTILKTNLDAIPEIVRQIRLRDLGGIIVIDFIDMDDRRNRHKVMAALEEELKNDRAPSKVLQFNDFGLVAITRKRVKQSLERTLSMPCMTCEGTGMVKNPTTVCNEIYVELRKMHKHLERRDVMLRVNPEVVKQLKSNGSKWLQDMEELVGKTILVKSDPSMAPEAFDIH